MLSEQRRPTYSPGRGMLPNVHLAQAPGATCMSCGQSNGGHNAHCLVVSTVSETPTNHRYLPTAVSESEQAVLDEWEAREPEKLKPGPNALREVVSMVLADVKTEAVRWHWHGRIPVGKLCIVQGDPGISKSMFTMYVTACLTTGRPFYGENFGGTPCDVLVISYEDSGADTLKPRAQAAGADMARVHVIQGVGENREQFTLPDDLLALRAKIEATGAGLVIIDPIGAAIGGGVDSYVDASVRRMLAPLAQLADDTGCTVLLIVHLSKGSKPAIHAGLGSVAFTGAARVVLAVGAAPDNAGARILASVKNNVSQLAPSLRYCISTWHGYAEADGEPFEAPYIEWVGTDDATADDLIAARNEQPNDRTEREEAREWLTVELGKGPRNAGELLREGVDNMGFAKRTLQRIAKRDLKVKRTREGERGPWVWTLADVAASRLAPKEA